MTKGKVFLVGAGPGDPGLVTIRAKELISSAEVVVYDDLANPDLLKWCRADCEKIAVGGHAQRHARPQETIESLLVARAMAGRQVVRLKEGDPFVSGRGGGEARRLAADGIPFEIVPGVIRVGEALPRHEAVNRFARLPLSGRRVVVTRARAQAGELCGNLEALGAHVIELPLVEIKPHVDRETAVEIFAEIGQYEWLVFTSANGVRHFFDLFLDTFRDIRALGVMRIACVGEATARPVRAFHLEVEICPGTGTAEALAEAMIDTGSLENAKILVVTGNLNRDVLVKRLDAAGAIVDTFQVYENVRADLTANPAAEEFRQWGADAVLFASSSAVQAFAGQAAALQPVEGARRPLAGSIGPRTSDAICKAGLRVDFEAKESTLDGLVTALVEKLGSAGEDR
jgi:uroporphyrinogen-III synthase